MLDAQALVPRLRGATFDAQAPVTGGVTINERSPVPWLRGAALERQVPIAGIVPWSFTARGEGACEIDAEENVSVSLRRPDTRNDVLGARPAGEAAVEAGRR